MFLTTANYRRPLLVSQDVKGSYHDVLSDVSTNKIESKMITEKENQIIMKQVSCDSTQGAIERSTEQESVDSDEEEFEFSEIFEAEDRAAALFGCVSDTECSYKLGSLPRQPLYACVNCTSDNSQSDQPGAVCLACSLICHKDHEMVEMYTKRDFTCDCGNSKFSQSCQLYPQKPALNVLNKYDGTFSGKYCKCHRPYPDKTDDACPDEMIQCIVCENWFHLGHLKFAPGVDPKSISDYAELICDGCMLKHCEVLLPYYKLLNAFASNDENAIARNANRSDSSQLVSVVSASVL